MNETVIYDKIDEDYFFKRQIPCHLQAVYAVSRRLIAIMFNLDINELSYDHNLYELLKKYEPVWDKYNFFTMLSSVLDVDITTQQIDMISFFDILESRKSLTIGQWIDKLIYLLHNNVIKYNKEFRVSWEVFNDIQKNVTQKRLFFELFFIVPILIFILFLIFISIVT